MKKILVMLGFVAASVAANASYLYWQVTDTTFNGNDIAGASIKAGNTTFKDVYYYDVNSSTSILISDSNGLVETAPGATYYVDLGSTDYSSYSFYIEIFNYDSASRQFNNIGYTETTYTELTSKGYVSTSLTEIPKVWTGSSSTPGGPSYNVPEPTSALMMLIGLAGLALKRKRV